MEITIFGSDLGTSNSSVEIATGDTACEVTVWWSNTAVECKMASGIGKGGGITSEHRGLTVVVTVGMQANSQSQAWCYDGAVVSSVGGASNGPSSGSTWATVAGFSFESAGYSERVKVAQCAACGAYLKI